MPKPLALRREIRLLLALSFLARSTVLLHGEVVINEVMYHAQHAENTAEPFEEEFVELHNTDPANAVSLAGWSFTSGLTFTFPPATIPASGYLVIAADPAAFATKYPTVSATVLGPWTGRLGNDGERIRLVDQLGTEVDDITYSDDGDWARRRRGPLDNGHRGWIWLSLADRGGSSLELINPALSNKQGQNWADSTIAEGTPGAPNSTASSDIAPLITNVSHHPAVPGSSDLVRIRADLTDERGAPSLLATLRYRISTLSPGSFATVAMKDDGLSDDELPNDGTFAATIPAHADGTVIEFYVEASDGGQARTWPGPTDDLGAQGANALFVVEDSPLTNTREVYRLVLSVPEDQEFAHGNFNTDSNAQMNATFIATRGADREIRYLAGLRRRGAGSRNDSPRTMRLNLPGDAPWDGQAALNLNAHYGYLQIFGHKIFAASCLPAGTGRSVKLLVNGEDEADGTDRHYGYYAHMEPQGNLSIDRQYPDDSAGNLYRKRRPSTDLAYHDGDLTAYPADGWFKGTNQSDWDWADLDALLGALNDTSNPNYLTNLKVHLDVEQWLRWFAVMTLLNNGETNISTGTDDDYYLYRGLVDPRFKLIPHDLDTILGEGDSSANTDPETTIFDMFEDGSTIPILEDFIRHPEVLPRYYYHLRDLLRTSFSKPRFDALVQECLDFVPSGQRNNIIAYMDQRRAYVLSLVDPPLTVQSTLPLNGGLPYTNSATLNLGGSFNVIDAAAIQVNGVEATLDVVNGTWTIGPAANLLVPGINHIALQAIDADSNEIAREFFEIWYDDGNTQALSGSLGANQTLTAAAGPYLVTTDLTIPAGVTLTIEPGTSVYFASGTRLTVLGTLRAEGTLFQPIRFTQNPASPASWAGVYFAGTATDNRMTHLIQSYSTSASHSLEVVNSRLTLSHVRWTDTTETIIETSAPQMLVLDCEFPPTSGSEVIHGTSLSGNEYFHLDSCFFNTSSGYNDIIDFSGGRRPGPIIYVTNNIFNGGTDDCLDLDGIDAHIEGNIFRDVHTDDPSRPSTSNAIATDGDAHITIVRNVFDDVDHALLLKNESDAVFENNVVVNASLGAINFREPLRPEVDAGSHVEARGNIFFNNAVTFRFPDHLRSTGTPPVITADHNIMPVAEHIYGTGNLDGDPGFLDLLSGDFRLLPGSPARGTGINGSDMGADVPCGALLTGAPPAVTAANSATLRVHIAGISGIQSGSFTSEFRWRLDGGTWSANNPLSTPITLAGLAPGLHTVEAVAKDSAGFWQAGGEAAAVSWTVDPNHSVLRINEVLADNRTTLNNGGTFPDYVELYNDGSTPIVLTGMSLTDDPLVPNKFVFPSTTLNGGERLLLFADAEFAAPGIHLGFALASGGESVHLFAPDGTTVIDEVVFGPQVADCSIGRVGRLAEWDLNVPTPLGANVRKGTGSKSGLRINEWLAGSALQFCDDFVELYNPKASPLALAGLYFTDDPGVQKRNHQIAPLSFIGAGDFRTFWASGNPSGGGDQLSFRLNANAEWIGLYDDALNVLDLVPFNGQVTDVSMGLFPDGGSTITSYPLPTPGISNSESGMPTTQITSLVAIDHVWAYEQSDTDLGTVWRAPAYDDSLWSSGAGLLYVESSSLPGPKNTALTLGAQTYYFRSEFTFTGDPSTVALSLQTVIDDGAVIYLNGQEIQRLGIADPYDHSSDATRTIGNAGYEGPFPVSNTPLVSGTNVLAAEVHQVNGTSSDIVFGLTLDAAVTTPGTPTPEFVNALKLINGLRITELMYDPDDGSDREFIELQNVSGETIDLTGVRFSEGISFVFPSMSLAPGDHVLVVSNLAAFVTKYGGSLPVAGVYTGQLSNGGEEIVLQLPEPFEANIQKFTYDDAWYPLSDGQGHSLEFIDPTAPISQWNSSGAWRTGALQGTPGSTVFLSAGVNQVITLPAATSLSGSVSGTWSPTMQWSVFSGPGNVNFSAPTSLDTAATFSLPGTYVLRLTGQEGGFQLTSGVVITVDDTYEAWKARLGVVGGPADNDDGDELLNIDEYAFERDPFSFNGSAAPEFGYDGSLVTIDLVSYPRKSDIQVDLETSLDLFLWSPVTFEFVSGTPDEQVVRFAIAPDQVHRAFFRFAVRTLP